MKKEQRLQKRSIVSAAMQDKSNAAAKHCERSAAKPELEEESDEIQRRLRGRSFSLQWGSATAGRQAQWKHSDKAYPAVNSIKARSGVPERSFAIEKYLGHK